MIRIINGAIATVVLLLLQAGSAQAATAITSRAGAHADFGRLVFEAPQSARPRASLDGSRLTITFPEAVETDLGRVRRHLFRYLRDVSLDTSGRRITATLLQPVRLREAVIDGFFVIDLRQDPDGRLEAPKAPSEPSRATTQKATTRAATTQPVSLNNVSPGKAGAEGPNVRVRAGQHPGFSRLVFDWRREVDYRVESGADDARIHFKRPARFDLRRVLNDLPRGIAALEQTASATAGGSALRVGFDGGRRIRHFRDGPRVVIDVLPGRADDRRSASRPPLPAERTPPAAANKPAKAAETLQAAVAAPATVSPAVLKKPTPQPVEPEKPDTAPAPGKSAAPESPAKIPAAETARPAEPTGPKPRRQPLALMARDIAQTSSNDRGLRLSARAEKGIAFLEFTWDKPTGLAAFERGGALWLVFDRPAAAATDPVARLGAHIEEVALLPHEDAAIYRLVLRPGWRPSITRNGSAWRVKLWKARPRAPVVPPIQIADSGVRVVVSGVRHVVPVNDPEIGDELLVVPLANANLALPVLRRFVQFRILPSLQGLVLLRQADAVQIEALADGVLVSAENGLVVGAKPKVDEDSALSGQRAGLRQPLFAFWSWSGDASMPYRDREAKLLADMALAKPKQRLAPRMALAQFYLANAQAGRAAGLLEIIAKDHPKQARSAMVRGMRGLANLMLGKNDLALKELNSVTVARYPDVVLWRGAARAQAGEFERAAEDFELASPFLPSVPKARQPGLYRAWLRTAHALEDRKTLAKVLDAFAAIAASQSDQAFIALMEGHRLSAKDRHVEALQRYRIAAREGDRKTSAEARLAMVDSHLAMKRIGVDEAAEQLDLLRYAWRGDSFEVDLLERLARMQFERGEYRSGLASLKQALAFLPAGEATEKLAATMTGVFAGLFLEGRADEMDPVEALALYNDFRELTPSGKEGDKMIRKLAERLVEVDLLDEAGDLLEEQIRYRAKGVQRAQIGTRLAQIRLMDRDPDAARQALDRTKPLQMPADLAGERRRIRAQVALAKGQHQRALAQIAGDSSQAARKIKLDTLWAAKKWDRFSEAAFAYLDERLRSGAGFDEHDKALLPRLATAYRLSGDTEGLSRFRARFADVMNGTGAAGTVEALAGKERSAALEQDIRKRAASVADTSAIEALLNKQGAKGG